MPGQCISPVTFTVTVNPILTPTFTFALTQTICQGNAVPVLPSTSTNGITGSWSPSVVSNTTSGVYTFTTASGQCADPTVNLTMTVNPTPTTTARPDTTVTEGSVIPPFNPNANPSGVNVNWSNSNQGIGLPPSGVGIVPSFVATNPGSAPASGVITLTPVLNGCSGAPAQYVINVIPLVKSVFVPNVFSPNNDGKNDLLYVYGNHINKMELRIFNQWGQEVEVITDKSKGWDGKFKGRPQPVGVYVYTLKVVLTDGKAINMKGNISLLR
jgi:large repetitive protein